MFHELAPATGNLSGVLALSPSFSLMSLNQAARQILGCERVPGDYWPLERLFSDRYLEEAQAKVKDALQNGHPHKNITGSMVHSNGKTIPCHYSAIPLFEKSNKIIGVILNFRGLVLRRPPVAHYRARQQLAYMPRLTYQKLVDELPEGLLTIDSKWRITNFNQAATDITGYSRQEVMGKKCWEIFRSAKCHKNCPVRLAMDQSKAQTDLEIITLTRSGQHQNLIVNIGLFKDNHGAIAGAVETFRPVNNTQPTGIQEEQVIDGIIGKSPIMQSLFNKLPDVAASDTNVLISGESGTGKEIISRAIHDLSHRRHQPFVAVNCAALSETLLESELFGHEKGAFTGADQERIGRFELVGKGTLFLDEIGELRPDLQVKLLRVIEQRSFERVGGNRMIKFEGRIISATNQDLHGARSNNQLREDLYYRLRTVPITIPPLRDRLEDIPVLVELFLKKFNKRTGKCVRSIDPKIMRMFMNYSWPGNVRELERCIEHAFVFVQGPVIFERHLPDPQEFRQSGAVNKEPFHFGLNSHDKESIVWALTKAAGRRQIAAELLGISRTSMWRRMKNYGLL
jgi:PAS domain S-box-containing protein